VTVQVVRFTVRGVPRDADVGSAAVGLGRPFTAVYDGTCKVCSRLSKLLEKWDRDGKFEVVPSQAPGVQARFPWIPARAYREALQLIGPGGRTWQGAAAIEKLLDELPKGRLVSWIFRIPFVRPLADRFYKWFARNRYKFGCGQHCLSRPLNVDFGDEAGEASA
jgi:predicted DCC family thiol-disulfide oxidoreductase YuxK